MKQSLLCAVLVLSGGLVSTRAYAQDHPLETHDAFPLDASDEYRWNDAGWNDEDGRLDDAQPIQQPATLAPKDIPQLPSTVPPPPTASQSAQYDPERNVKEQPAQQEGAQDGELSTHRATTLTNNPGQWVFTQQYGWVYAPYDRSYTYVTDDVSAASMYVYRPVTGWSWLVAPWVISVGPRPYWGNYGPYRYSYYAHPWFRARLHRGSVHYYGRPNYNNHAGPLRHSPHDYRGGGGGRIGGGIGGRRHGGHDHRHHR
ncbi:MAG: hypothetical protein H7Z43_11075 [Clostridia bacterium]|nr:hypothetical protein [Deltaproteobacteria bacterium]